MATQTAEQLTHKKCKPCEWGIDPVPVEQARELLRSLSGWTLTADNKRIRKEWVRQELHGRSAILQLRR